MRFLLRERDPDGELASEYVRHGVCVLNLLQGIKHTREDLDLRQIASLILSVETLFAFLLAGEV
jgi:hypothetical protein